MRKERICAQSRRHIEYVALSNLPERQMLIDAYIKLCRRIGEDIDRHLSNDIVRRMHDISRKVGREAYRMRGLVRFQELADGVYYARILPDHDILGLIAPYFAIRLADRRWIIHDEKRHKAVVYDRERWYSTEIRIKETLRFSTREQQYRRLWKEYFQRIAIDERSNPRAQKQFMPRRYWRNLTEMQDDQ
ncbi:MAG: TIGR03915 family putative DNA repair protein [Candidatus Omnitrophica bacterium]|nr:TIGR03915 family putative DNA repair protein [Candidatus Omnitrophota bacterium]